MRGLKNRCLISSLAYLIKEDPIELIKETGFTGLEEIWEEPVTEVFKYRGHHIQELIDICLKRGKALVHIQPVPAFGDPSRKQEPKQTWDTEKSVTRFKKYLLEYPSLILTNYHALAGDTKNIWDPDTDNLIPVGDFNQLVREAWILI